ncbi:uncharacterized protein LOC122301741 [Carya illinoinensis]|uniref:uncharacterized protein LOC122301741 n=1 Tax=Carya illinoinensis TaxID=32201 RepID=UPI001C719147|nr:uncharacterized protein LOC122301741 [Carya illinoinensis]
MDLPYSTEVMVVLLPPKFKVPLIDMYDGSRDPMDHLENFKAHMILHGFLGEVACLAFSLTLKGITRGWFGTLHPGTINNFDELAKLFLTQFMASRHHWRPTAYLLTIKQKEGESLKAYLTRFNKENLTTNDQDEKIILAALLGGIWPRSLFMIELAKKAPSTLREFMDRADDYINAKDILQALLESRKKETRHGSKGSNRDRKTSLNQGTGGGVKDTPPSRIKGLASSTIT